MLRFVWDLSMAEDVNEFRQRHDLIPVTTTKVKSTIRPGLQGNIEHEQKRTGCNLRWCDAVVRRMASSHKIVVVSKDSREVNAYRIRTFRFTDFNNLSPSQHRSRIYLRLCLTSSEPMRGGASHAISTMVSCNR